MEELEELKNRLAQERPVNWASFPDLGLYMDQVISYMPRQLIHYGDGDVLTSAMVNNYIKDGLLPRAEGKRYSQPHLAYLTAICILKQVLSVREVKGLLAVGEQRKGSTQGLYDYFCRQLDTVLTETAQCIPAEWGEDDLPRLALALALRSYANRLACQRVLDIMAEHGMPEEVPGGKHHKEKKS